MIYYICSIFYRQNLHHKQRELLHALWYSIRRKTIDTIFKIKDEIMNVVRNERIAKIVIAALSLVVGVTVGTAGIALSPLTAGTTGIAGVAIAVSTIGGVAGIAASVGSISASRLSRIMSNNKLKKAQEHVSLDQQLSMSINDIEIKLNQSNESTALLAATGLQNIGNVGRFGIGVTTGVESAVNIGASAARTATHATGLALGAISLAVTVPIDIGFIVYHSIQMHKSSKDTTGGTENNRVIQWLLNEAEELLKGISLMTFKCILIIYRNMQNY